MRARRLIALLGGLTLVAGCVPGPRPIPETAHVAPPLSWRDAASGDGTIDPHWWRAYGDPALDALVDKALEHNTDVLTAIANVDQSRAELRLTRSELFPQVAGVGNAEAAHSPGVPGSTTTFQIGPLASWEIDLFGRVRALTEASRRTYVASQADRDAAALSVASQTVQSYIRLIATDEQIKLIEETTTARKKGVDIEQDRMSQGYDSRQEYLQALGEYQAVAAQLPAQQWTQRKEENALAVLTGDLPQAIGRASGLSRLALPVVPPTLPSALVRRRPDIAAAEYTLAASDATLAAERAAFLPSIVLTGEYFKTFASTAGYDPTTLWSIGNSILTPLITAPLFEGGALRANFDAAAAKRDKAAYAYKAAVLGAFADAENGLTGVEKLHRQVALIGDQVRTAGQALDVARDRNGEGYTDFLNVLDAERTLFSAQQSLIGAQSDELVNLASLAAALGGGWSPDSVSRGPSTPSAPVFQKRTMPLPPHGEESKAPR